MSILIAICSFGTISLLILGLTMRSEQDIAKHRMQAIDKGTGYPAGEFEFDPGLDAAVRDRIVLPVLRRLAAIGMRLTPSGALKEIDTKLETAGRPWSMSAVEFIGLRTLSIAVLIPTAFLLVRFVDVSPLLKMVLFAATALTGVILPDVLLQSRINARQIQIRRSLPDTLDLLTVSVEAGLSLDAAMQKVADKLPGPLADEMNRALQEMQIGRQRADALKDMAQRAKVLELNTFVAAICQADQLGVSIANVLKVQSETLRAQRSQKAREEGARLPVKMLFPLVFFIFPSILIVIAGPAIIQIGRALGIIGK